MGSTLFDAVGGDHTLSPELLPSSRLEAPSLATTQPQVVDSEALTPRVPEGPLTRQ